MRRVAIIASASGNGKTTLGRALAARLGVRFVELDALVHGPNWTETPDAELRATLAPILHDDGWVIDGDYERKLGTLVLDAADTIVWLDQPTRVWLPRLIRRSSRRVRSREELWNGNRETWRDLFWGRESLIGYALTAAAAPPPRMARAAREPPRRPSAQPRRGPALDRELTPGTNFADHVIRGVCGRGGMGIVYRATHVPLDREVALKVITPAYSGDQEFRRRFRREFRATARSSIPT